jgi:hypothetical protein
MHNNRPTETTSRARAAERAWGSPDARAWDRLQDRDESWKDYFPARRPLRRF